jgi:hypothetical protein
MNSFVIASIVVIVVLLVGLALAGIITLFSRQVNRTQSGLGRQKNTLNPQVSLGHPLPLDAAPEEQLAQAQLLAAKRAAQLPRGANMRIGRLGAENLLTARQGAADDPVTAVKIARFHGWELFQTEAPWLVPAEPEAAAAPAAAPAAKTADDLVPGKDYPFIEITDDMSPEEVRKARVANAKAKSAALKALKEAGETAAPAAAEAAAKAAAKPAAPPPKLEYEEIPITDDMSPEEVRKARVANAKAKAAAAKAAKEAGGAAPSAAPELEAAAQEPVAAASAPAAKPAIPANIPAPDYIEISDDLDPAALRKARIANAKARSAYHKALKEAGIDPATVE